MIGIRNHKLSGQLQVDGKFSLQKTIEKICHSEMVKEQNKEIRKKIKKLKRRQIKARSSGKKSERTTPGQN